MLRFYYFKEFKPKAKLNKKKFFELDLDMSLKSEYLSKNYSIVFDAQCLQTKTRFRGIGKYSKELLFEYCKFHPNQNFFAFLTNLGDKDECREIFDYIKSIKPENLDIAVLDCNKTSGSFNLINIANFVNKQIEHLQTNVVVVLSAFEKIGTYVPLMPSKSYTLLSVLYDVIPYQEMEEFLNSRF